MLGFKISMPAWGELLPLADAALIFLSLGLLRLLYASLVGQSKQGQLPPGPKPLPLIGNLLDMPKGQVWLHWAKHKELYGPISSVSAFGSHIIIISDPEVASELLEKRSQIYASRPLLTFGGEMCGWDRSTVVLPYGETLRSHRRFMQQYLGTRAAVSRFNDVIETSAHTFLLDVLSSPDDLLRHIRAMAGATILRIAYGYKIDRRRRDPLVDLAERAVRQFSDAMRPGVWLVDILPSLKYIPIWFPGATFTRKAREYYKCCSDLADKPYAFVRAKLASGEALPSFASGLIEKELLNNEENKAKENIVKWSSATLYGGGADTTVSVLYSFFYAMMLHPDVQRQAQAELDEVVGTDRLPSLQDRDRLPYVNALAKEVLRWCPIVPMGFPHVTTEDDNYRGYFIPKGAPVLANIWQFTHDPALYDSPHTFNPARFLASASASDNGVGKGPERDPSDFVFGFGRRLCPGKELARASFFLGVAMSLHVFDISRPVDGRTGRVVEQRVEYTAGTVSHPTEFKCSVKPRSEKHIALVETIRETVVLESHDADLLASLG